MEGNVRAGTGEAVLDGRCRVITSTGLPAYPLEAEPDDWLEGVYFGVWSKMPRAAPGVLDREVLEPAAEATEAEDCVVVDRCTGTVGEATERLEEDAPPSLGMLPVEPTSLVASECPAGESSRLLSGRAILEGSVQDGRGSGICSPERGTEAFSEVDC